jgi:hypothetical protein
VRERLTTLVFALVALLLFATFFIRHDALGPSELSRPTSVDLNGNGLVAVAKWLQGEGVRTVSVRERFTTLGKRTDLPASGNLLIVSLPAIVPFHTDEAVALDDWIRAGNTLLVLAALQDRPDWTQQALPVLFNGDLEMLTGLSAERVPGKDEQAAPKDDKSTPAARARQRDEQVKRMIELAQRLDKPRRETLVPNRAHPYLNGVESAIALSDFKPLAYTLGMHRDGFMLALAHERESGNGALWVRPDGSGTIIISGFVSLFSNRALGLADNARLLANIVGLSVAPGGAVLFDDTHQGLSAFYDPDKFFSDRRLYETLAIMTAVWLIWVLGATRLQLPRSRSAAPREAELVRAVGLYLARVLRPAAAARRAFAHFFQRLRAPGGRARLEPAALWDYLENHPRLARADVQQLKEWYARAHAEERVPLARLHNLIISIERQLAA